LRAAITGSSGLVGSALRRALAAGGDEVVRLVRHESAGPGERSWDPARPDPSVLAGCDTVIHLAGEPIAGGRWSAARKARIRDSRVAGSAALAQAIARSPTRPATLIAASAIGFYGDRGDEILTETSPAGTDFLAEVCTAWEGANFGAAAAGVRVVCLRFGIILAKEGGALKKMLPPFRLGLGGRLGSGRQYMSWVTIDDVVGMILEAARNPALAGPVNAVAPAPVTNSEFTRALGRALSRPAIFPVPAAVLRLLVGEMADALLLSSARVTPARLAAAGYRFKDADLGPALTRLLA
jgi:uncharacterized protein (TIGR01777 family)